MNCDEYLPLISAHLDGANSEIEERRLQEHLYTCEACRTLLSQMEQNDALLKSSAAVPPADLTERIMREVRKEQKASSSGKKRIISMVTSGLAVAALLGLVIWKGLPFANPSKDSASVVDAGKMLFSALDPAVTAAPEMMAEEVESPRDIENAAIPDFQTADGTAKGSSEKRQIVRDTPAAPVLVIWDAGTPNMLDGFDLAELPPYADAVPPQYPHFLTAVPMQRESGKISPITLYAVSYKTMMQIYYMCADVYQQNEIYFPDEYTVHDSCRIILINTDE